MKLSETLKSEVELLEYQLDNDLGWQNDKQAAFYLRRPDTIKFKNKEQALIYIQAIKGIWMESQGVLVR